MTEPPETQVNRNRKPVPPTRKVGGIAELKPNTHKVGSGGKTEKSRILRIWRPNGPRLFLSRTWASEMYGLLYCPTVVKLIPYSRLRTHYSPHYSPPSLHHHSNKHQPLSQSYEQHPYIHIVTKSRQKPDAPTTWWGRKGCRVKG